MTRRLAVPVFIAFAALACLASCEAPTDPENPWRPTPKPILGGRAFVSLALGDFHSCGLAANGEAFCWGVNSQGQSGNGLSADEGIGTPLVVLGGFLFTNLYAGGAHTCGILTNGSTMCWGNNVGGQLGTGSGSEQVLPTPVSGSHKFTTLSLSTVAHSCGIDTEGAAWCWGQNQFGRLGDGTQEDRTTPVKVSGELVFTSIAAGGGHTCGLTVDSTAYCWGLNERGQIGDGTTQNRTVPVPVATTLKFKAIAAGLAHTCALTEEGDAYCWGDNIAGALGDGTIEPSNAPVAVSDGNTFTTLALGERHSCGLTPEGISLCWGYNAFGALGIGSLAPVITTPTLLITPIIFKHIATGGYHTCGITTSDVTYCWGDNTGHQLGAE